jgi:hypothetical protein
VRRRLGVAAAAALLVLAGCGGDDEPEPIGGDEAAPDEGADPTELDPEGDLDGDEGEEEEIDVTVVPDEITEDYVEAVLAELEQIRYEALVKFRENDGELTIEVMDMTASVFTAEEVEHERDDLESLAAGGYEGLRDTQDMRPVEPAVIAIHDVTEQCLFAETRVSFEGLLEEAPEARSRLYHLVTQERELVEDYNPTPWVIVRTPADVETSREERPCTE